MPNLKTINNHSLRRNHYACYCYTDEMAFDAAYRAAKKLRRGQTFHSEMSMSQNSLEILMNSFSDKDFDIVGNSEDGTFYTVSIHRYTRIEQWANKHGKRASAIRKDLYSDVEAIF